MPFRSISPALTSSRPAEDHRALFLKHPSSARSEKALNAFSESSATSSERPGVNGFEGKGCVLSGCGCRGLRQAQALPCGVVALGGPFVDDRLFVGVHHRAGSPVASAQQGVEPVASVGSETVQDRFVRVAAAPGRQRYGHGEFRQRFLRCQQVTDRQQTQQVSTRTGDLPRGEGPQPATLPDDRGSVLIRDRLHVQDGVLLREFPETALRRQREDASVGVLHLPLPQQGARGETHERLVRRRPHLIVSLTRLSCPAGGDVEGEAGTDQLHSHTVAPIDGRDAKTRETADGSRSWKPRGVRPSTDEGGADGGLPPRL